jgi:hypothetical protein
VIEAPAIGIDPVVQRVRIRPLLHAAAPVRFSTADWSARCSADSDISGKYFSPQRAVSGTRSAISQPKRRHS